MNTATAPTSLIPFAFQDVRLREACWIDEKPYFTRRAIGEWLGAAHPDRYVAKIVERNPYIKQFAVRAVVTVQDMALPRQAEDALTGHSAPEGSLVRLTNDQKCSVPNLGTEPLQGSPVRLGTEHPQLTDPLWHLLFPEGSLLNLRSKQTVRSRRMELEVFDPMGLQLIVMESHLRKAIAFKLCVARLVWAFVNGELRGFAPKPREPQYPLLKHTPARGQVIKFLAAENGLSVTTVYRRIKRIERGLPLDGRVGRGTGYIWHRHIARFEECRLLWQKGLKLVRISELTHVPYMTVWKWTKKFKANWRCKKLEAAHRTV